MKDLKKNLIGNGRTLRVKTTPDNVREAHEGLFHATMNLPTAAAHCGMTQKELKMTFFEYLKYNAPNFEIIEDTSQVSWREE